MAYCNCRGFSHRGKIESSYSAFFTSLAKLPTFILKDGAKIVCLEQLDDFFVHFFESQFAGVNIAEFSRFIDKRGKWQAASFVIESSVVHGDSRPREKRRVIHF